MQEKLVPRKINSDLTPTNDEEYTIEDLIHDTHQIIKYRYTEVLVLPTYKKMIIQFLKIWGGFWNIT